ncbi:MAG: hypothetical protein ACKVON_11735 [Beijerinckiaceae bacterium]
MPDTRIKRGIYGFAAVLLMGLALLRFFGADLVLLKILVIASGLLVLLLLITYRAFAGVAEAARHAPQPPASAADEDEDD